MASLFIKDGDEYLCSAGGALLLAAGAVYGPPDESTDEGRKRASALIDAILSVASERGFSRRDLLETMLSRNEISARVREMATDIDRCLGRDGLQIAMDRTRGAQ